MFKSTRKFISDASIRFISAVMDLDPAAVFVLGVFGVVLGLAILAQSNPAYMDPTDGPKFTIFLVLMTILVATYVAAIPPTFGSFRNVTAIARRYDPNAQFFVRVASPRFWFLLVLFYIVDMAPFLWFSYYLPNTKFPHGVAVTIVLTFFGASSAFFLSCSVWEVDSATRAVFPNEAAVRVSQHAGGADEVDERSKRLVNDYIALRGELFQSVTLLGLMVSLLTLAIGAFRYCNRNYDTLLYQKFRPEFVLVLGVYYSGLVGLVLVPPYLRLIQAGRVVRDVLNPLADGAPRTIADFLDLRKKLEETLTLNVGLTETFRNSILVLSPLISGVVPLLVGLGTPDKAEEAAAPKAVAVASPASNASLPDQRTTPPPTTDAASAPRKEKAKAPASDDKGHAAGPAISPPGPLPGR